MMKMWQTTPKQQFGEYTAGDIKYKDINRDGIIDEQDIVPIGYPTTPEIIYGFGFSVGYKAFDFNCFFQGSARSSFFISPLRITPFAQPYDPDNELGGKQANNALLQVIADNHWTRSPTRICMLFGHGYRIRLSVIITSRVHGGYVTVLSCV